MKYPKLREIKEAIKALIIGPYTNRFPYKPITVPEKFRGSPEFQKDDCVGCGACAQVCPTGAIEMVDITDSDPPLRRLIVRHDICIFCGNCEANCITSKGIVLSNKFDLAGFNRADFSSEVEKELVLCKCCGEVIAPRDHILWIYKELGQRAFSNPTLFLTYLKDSNLFPHIEEQKPLGKELPQRSDFMQVLCPKCRRTRVLEEIKNK